jgi:competence transcription factor ComK
MKWLKLTKIIEKTCLFFGFFYFFKKIYTKMGGGVKISLQPPPPPRPPLNKNEENKKWLKLTKITEKTCFIFWIFLI